MWIKLAYILGHHDLWLAKSFQECAHMDGEVSPDGAGKGSSRVGLTKHNSTSLDYVETFPDHGNDRAGAHVFDEAREKSLAGNVGVVLFEELFGSLKKSRISLFL